MNILPHRSRAALLAVLALAVAPYFIGLGESSLWDSNEAFYAETPREMIESGDYINPSFNYQPRFNKPPLSYWVVAAAYKMVGVSEAAERLTIAVGAMILLAIAFGLGRAIYSVEAGLLAAIALAANPRFLMFSRRILIDVYLAMFMSASLLFFVLAETQPRRRRLWLILMYASVGLGVMTKGPVAAILAGAAFLVFVLATKRLRMVREMMLPAGILIIAAIVLPWYVAVYRQHGWSYIESFLIGDNLSRYTQPVWGPRRGILFYLPVLAGDLFPWSLFLLAAGWSAARSLIVRLRSRPAPDATRGEGQMPNSIGLFESDESKQRGIILWIWMAVIVLFFSLSSSKEDLYILPIYPAACAVVGGFLARCLSDLRNNHDRFAWPAGVTGTALVALGVGILYVLNIGPEGYKVAGYFVIASILLIAGLLAIAATIANKRLMAVLVVALGVVVVNWVLAAHALADFERYKPVRAFCEVIAEKAGPEAMIGYYKFASPSMVFYLRRPIFEYYREEDLLLALSSDNEVYCLMTARDYDDLAGRIPSPAHVLARRPVFQVKLKSILDRIELPDVVLVSNRGGASGSR